MSKQNQYDYNEQQKQIPYCSVIVSSQYQQQVNLKSMARTKIYKVGKN